MACQGGGGWPCSGGGGADLIVLDINLPGMDGFEFLQTLRRESTVPVIIVSAREADEDIVMGLGIGADEFVAKPFTPRVLVARIRAVLRRSRSTDRRSLTFGPYTIDLEGYALTREGQRLILSTKEEYRYNYIQVNVTAPDGKGYFVLVDFPSRGGDAQYHQWEPGLQAGSEGE